MAWAPALGGYLLISGPVARQQVPFRLLFWRGGANDTACRVRVGGLPGFAHAEGATPARIDGQARIVIVRDDGEGDGAAGRDAHFLLCDPARLGLGD